MPQSVGHVRYVFVALTLRAKWATMQAPQQTIVWACANLRCKGATANLWYFNFERPIFQGRCRLSTNLDFPKFWTPYLTPQKMVKSFLPLLIPRFWHRCLPESIFPQKIVLKKSKFSVLGLAGFENLMYFCTVFHGIRFKVSEDWLSGDNQFFFAPTRKNREQGMSLPRFIGGTE